MSTTRNIINISNQKTEFFVEKFNYYLDSLDKLFHLQGVIGLNVAELSALNKDDQNKFKSYLFIMESVNTTCMGALNLFANNYCSDAYALLRIMYEVMALMHYGNQSPENSYEIYETIFKSGKNHKEHSMGEWNLTVKAEKLLEKDSESNSDLRKFTNNFGSHISRTKIVLGNLSLIGNRQVSIVFCDNYSNREYLLGLDLLFGLFLRIIKEYNKQSILYPGAEPSIEHEIEVENSNFLRNVRPLLISSIEEED